MPWKGEKDPYKIWLSEIILQQTRVDQGLAYYNRYIKKYPSINKLAADHLDGHLVLTEPYDDQIFYKIDNLNERFFVHHFRIYNGGELNKNFQKYMALAYKIGQREHVTKSGKQST